MNEKMRQPVGNCFINALWWTKCFPAGGGGRYGDDLVGKHPPSFFRSILTPQFLPLCLPPFCLHSLPCIIPHVSGPFQPCPDWVVDTCSDSCQSPRHEVWKTGWKILAPGRQIAIFRGAEVELGWGDRGRRNIESFWDTSKGRREKHVKVIRL